MNTNLLNNKSFDKLKEFTKELKQTEWQIDSYRRLIESIEKNGVSVGPSTGIIDEDYVVVRHEHREYIIAFLKKYLCEEISKQAALSQKLHQLAEFL